MNKPPRIDPQSLAAKAAAPAKRALQLHPFYRGKVQILPKVPVRELSDFSVWYTPGVAAACRAIVQAPDQVFEQTNRGNSIAVVSDGSRVLGLGDIGPAAGLPVMEGKALLFKYLGGVDAVPLCVDARSADELVRLVEAIAPSFGAINLEDIAQPKCFEVLDRLRRSLPIAIWHDDQQGTATVVLAGLLNALQLVGKKLGAARVAMVGAGSANIASFRLLRQAGLDPALTVVCDSRGILHPDRRDLAERRDIFPDKWRICTETNADGRTGGIAEALAGADACLAFSTPGPGIIAPDAVARMAPDAIVFACANPVPEIWPWEAMEAGARIVATGRSDFPNQVNNSLAFPGIFRGVLDVRAAAITDAMTLAAANALAKTARTRGLADDALLPPMDDATVPVRLAIAVGLKAQETGLARVALSRDDLEQRASATIRGAQQSVACLMTEGLIPAPPPADA
jgi:malate dehydrogenase (oxaloacetate-decarboxylating)